MNYLVTIIAVLGTVGFVILIIWLSPVVINEDEDDDRSGGTGGGAAGCFDVRITVWSKNETQDDKFAELVMVKYLKEGDLVGTTHVSNLNEIEDFVWTRATDVTVSSGGYWDSRSFNFMGSDEYITVTASHLMIIWVNGISYFTRADQVQIGDHMKVGRTVRPVTRIRNTTLHQKVTVETEDGTILVNGVLASGFCDYNPETFDKVMKVEPMVKGYKSSHFGKVYNSMCMDNVAWKHSFMVNNGFFYSDL